MTTDSGDAARILVVDDERVIREILAEFLSLEGFSVHTVEDGEKALTELRLKPYDLLITDNNMPTLSGVELVKKVRSARMTLPVILASGRLPTEELDRNPWLQLAATLIKPFSSGQLLETVRQVLLAADDAAGRAATFFPVPAAGMRQIAPASQWGINE